GSGAGAGGSARAIPEFRAGENSLHPRDARRLAGTAKLRGLRPAARDRNRGAVVRRRRRQAIRQWRNAALRGDGEAGRGGDPRPAARAVGGLRALEMAMATQMEPAGGLAKTEQASLLEFRNMRIVYDNAIEAIRDVSIAVPEGGIVALLGSNGAGKSTLLKAMSGILYTEEGEIENGSIRFREEDVHHLAPDELVRPGI